MTQKEALERKKCWTCCHCSRVALPSCLHPDRRSDECPGWEVLGAVLDEED